MTVKLLIEQLLKLEQDAEVSIFWDGSPRGGVEGIYVSSGDNYGDYINHVVLVGDWSIYRRNINDKHSVVWQN
jgi:hypothetical protein